MILVRLLGPALLTALAVGAFAAPAHAGTTYAASPSSARTAYPNPHNLPISVRNAYPNPHNLPIPVLKAYPNPEGTYPNPDGSYPNPEGT